MTKKTTFNDASNFGATFTQLFRNEKPFGHQGGKFFYHLSKYFYLAELFTNVKLRAEQIPAYIQTLSDTFRKIINADVRYRQRQDDLPCAVGCRAFGVAPLGGGWYSPNIKVACNNAQVLEYICRQWCKRTNQYPHTISVQFDKVSNATKASILTSGVRQRLSARWQRIHTTPLLAKCPIRQSMGSAIPPYVSSC